MKTFFVRDVPAPLYEMIKSEAEKEHRSFAKQVVADLEAHFKMTGLQALTPEQVQEKYGWGKAIKVKKHPSTAQLKRWRREGLE